MSHIAFYFLQDSRLEDFHPSIMENVDKITIYVVDSKNDALIESFFIKLKGKIPEFIFDSDSSIIFPYLYKVFPLMEQSFDSLDSLSKVFLSMGFEDKSDRPLIAA